MATVHSIAFLVESHIRSLDDRIAGFEEGLQEVADGLHDLLVDAVPRLEGARRDLLLRQVVHLQSQIRGQLNKSGYSDLIEEFISGYDESEVFAKQILEALGHSSAMRVPMRADTLEQLKQFDLDAFEEFGADAVRQVGRELTLNTLVGKPRSAVIKACDAVLQGQFVGQGDVLADTALRSYDRTVCMADWQEAGITKFKYFGPADKKNRGFCRERVGKVFTLDQIKAISNGSAQFGDVLRYGGGPRCRHTWQPVVEG